jgi:signal transduction histidine kinase
MMRPFRNHFLLVIFISVACLHVPAQDNYRAVHWGIEEKMSVDPAIGMIKDVNGFLWIGTGGGGLLRFDGNHFKKYQNEINKNNNITSNDIRGLIEDSLHNIWIGSESGLCLYDIHADTFRTIALAGANPANRAIVPFWATREEVFCWDYPSAQWTAFNIHTLGKRSLAKMTADDIGNWFADRFSVFDTASNSIWIEKDSSQSFSGGLLQVSLTTGKKRLFSWACYRNITNHNHSFQCMHYDRRRNAVWINSPDGLVEFSLKDKKFNHITAMDSLVQLKNYDSQDGISIDTGGRVWMSTIPKGIIIYNPADGSLHLPFQADSSLQHKIAIQNLMIYCDPAGFVWTGSWSSQTGMYQLIPFNPVVNHYFFEPGKSNSLSDNFTFLSLDAGKGKIWIGTGDGLNILDIKTGFIRVVREHDLTGLESGVRHIEPVCMDTSTQKAWIIAGSSDYTAAHFYQMDYRSKKCVPVIVKDSNNQKMVDQSGLPIPIEHGLMMGFKNGVILGSVYRNRAFIFIGNSDSTIAKQILSFPAGYVDPMQMGTDGDHLLFIKGGPELSLSYVLDKGRWVLTHTPLDTISWANIYFNISDQTYWVNVKNNLQHLSRDFKLIRTYSQEDGLPDEDRGYAVPDNSGNVWFSTDHLIYRLNSKSGRISVLTERDGYQATGFFVGLTIVKSAVGDLYIPSGVNGKGITRIIPDKYPSTASSVYIQSLLVNQKPYYFAPGINREPELHLSYFENRFTIEPGIIDFNSPATDQFRYKLGESANWIYPSNNIIYYDNLSPGRYELIMQASGTNDFNGPTTTLHIQISPPWWQTWWAYTFFAIAFVSLLWAFLRYRSRALRAKNIQLEEKVMHRTKELKHSLEDLRETQNQLIQREKMASLGELTAGIAHEIQNPLNFVNNFSDLNTELLEELKTKIKSGNPDEAIAIADDVISNEQKIYHHGRRADTIVKGMLQHSRASTGQKELTDINALAEEYLGLSYQGLRAQDKSFNAVLKTNFDPGVGSIPVVPQDIGRVLLNLYNNAFYAVHEKKKQEPDGFQPTVSVSTAKTAAHIEISVNDNGDGISQKILDKIFQPFFTTKPTGKGTGLGLSLSYDIVKTHGGEIKVNTGKDEGTTFIIQLPF